MPRGTIAICNGRRTHERHSVRHTQCADERTEADHPSARRVLFAYPRPLVARCPPHGRWHATGPRHHEGDAHDTENGFSATITAFATGSMARRGIEPAMYAAYAVFFLETVGAVMIILGLFTRLFAAALAIEFAIITFVAHWPAGFAAGRGGWEYPLFWDSSCSQSRCVAAARTRSIAS